MRIVNTWGFSLKVAPKLSIHSWPTIERARKFNKIRKSFTPVEKPTPRAKSNRKRQNLMKTIGNCTHYLRHYAIRNSSSYLFFIPFHSCHLKPASILEFPDLSIHVMAVVSISSYSFQKLWHMPGPEKATRSCLLIYGIVRMTLKYTGKKFNMGRLWSATNGDGWTQGCHNLKITHK